MTPPAPGRVAGSTARRPFATEWPSHEPAADRTHPAQRLAGLAGTAAPASAASTDGEQRAPAADRHCQVEAVEAIVGGLRDGGRGTLLVACGTGNTRICQRAARALVPAGGLVVACPSIALVALTLRAWAALDGGHVAVAVCSRRHEGRHGW